MDTFRFIKARDVSHAVQAASHSTTAQQGAEVRFVAGGTTLLDLMKLNVERPRQVVDINSLPLDKVEKLPDGRLRIGALVRNFDLAHHSAVQSEYSVLSQALLSGASAQLRNMATTGGNLLQHALRLFSQFCDRLQQARAGFRLLRYRRGEPYACDTGHKPELHRNEPFRHECRVDRSRGDDPHSKQERPA